MTIPYATTTTKDTAEIGCIDTVAAAAISRPSGPIYIVEGVGGSSGYGLLHIESNKNRMKMIKGVGYATASAFIREVATNWTLILQGEDDRLILVCKKAGYDFTVIVEHHASRAFWMVITAIPRRVASPDISHY